MVEISDERLAELLKDAEQCVSARIANWRYKNDTVKFVDMHSILTELQRRRAEARQEPLPAGTVSEDARRLRQIADFHLSNSAQAAEDLFSIAERIEAAFAARPAAHPDDIAVDTFAAAMKAKLKWERDERHRNGWQGMSAEELSKLLYEHLPKGDPVDVANLAMMLHQNGQQIAARPAEPVGVREMEWHPSHTGVSGDAHTVPTLYTVRFVDDRDGWRWMGLGGHGYEVTAEAAKAAAQADYAQRIRSALATAPAPGLVEALRRIKDATPENTNSATAAEMASWTYAVAASALSITETGGAK